MALSLLLQASDSLPPPLSFIALIPVVPVGAADVGYLTAVSPAAATLFSLVLMRLKSAVSKPVMMAFASLLYGALCVFIYMSSSVYLKQLGWSISILYAVGPCSLNCTTTIYSIPYPKRVSQTTLHPPLTARRCCPPSSLARRRYWACRV